MSPFAYIHRVLAGSVKAVCLIALFAPANAQSTASLQGRVMDQAGAVVAGAQVTVYRQATGLERVVESDSEGNYQVVALPVGAYEVRVRFASGNP